MDSVGLSRSYPLGYDYLNLLGDAAKKVHEYHTIVTSQLQPEPMPEPIEPMPEPTPDRDSTYVDYSEIDYNGMDKPNTTMNDFKSHEQEQESNEKHIWI